MNISQKKSVMKSNPLKHLIVTCTLVLIFCFSLPTVEAQNQSVTIRVNYLPVIVPNTPSTLPNTYDVCKNIDLNLQTIYVDQVDTNNIALSNGDYTLIFSTSSDFSNPITGPGFSYTLTTNTQTIYAKATMNTVLACSNDTFSFVLNAKPEPSFSTQPISACFGKEVDLTTTILSITNGGTSPLQEFSLDSSNFIAISNPTGYDATALSGFQGGDYTLYARVKNTDDGCYSAIMPFNLHIDTMPLITLTIDALNGNTEFCDSTTLNLASFVTSTIPSTGVILEFSINDVNFASPISGTSVTSYPLFRNNTTAENLTIYVRAKMNSTNCYSIDTAVKNFNIKINPMPSVTVNIVANGTQVCDSSIIDLTSFITNHTSGSTLQFATTPDFAAVLEGTDATAYVINLGNTTTEDISFYVRASTSTTQCMSVGNAVKNFTLKVNPLPTKQTIIAGLSNGCSDNTIPYEIPSQANTTYAWSATGGTISGSGIATKDSVLWATANPTAQVQVEYTLTTNGKACSRTTILDVNVLQSPTQVNLEVVAGSEEFCDDGTNQIQLKASITGGTPNYLVAYSWTPNNGNSSLTTSGNTGFFNVTPTVKGVQYTYTINKVIDSKGCILRLP